MSAETAEDLRAAGAMVEKAWVQIGPGTHLDVGGSCVSNAIGLQPEVGLGTARHLRAAVALANHVGFTVDPTYPYPAIFEWNDALERTKAEVVKALFGAADAVEFED